jgi:membrane-associated phospholipid phosphatase
MTIPLRHINTRFAVLCCTLLMVPAILPGQHSEQRQQTDRSTADVHTGYALESTNQVPLVVGYTAVTLALFASDQQSYDLLNKWQGSNAVVRNISSSITEVGNGLTSLALFGGLYGYSQFVHDERAHRTATIGLESFVLSGVTVQLLKHVFSRERPTIASVNRGAFHGLFAHFRESHESHGSNAHFDAFPSGHTASVFAAATVISDSYHSTALTIGVYSSAVSVGISRVTEQTHWASDVFVGALIGYYSAKFVERWNENERDNISLPRVSISPAGIRLTIVF